MQGLHAFSELLEGLAGGSNSESSRLHELLGGLGGPNSGPSIQELLGGLGGPNSGSSIQELLGGLADIDGKLNIYTLYNIYLNNKYNRLHTEAEVYLLTNWVILLFGINLL